MSYYASQHTAQYLSFEHVIEEFYQHGLERLENATVFQVFLLACMAGGFIAMGALFSVILAQGDGDGRHKSFAPGPGIFCRVLFCDSFFRGALHGSECHPTGYAPSA